MSQTFKIYRWDSVLFGNNTDPVPIIYAKPEKSLLEFAEKNKNVLLVKLHAPGSIYDNKKVIGVWRKSSEIPNCRINFFEETELYVIVLYAPWHGYPDYLGKFSVYGLEGGKKATDINTPTDNLEDKSLVENNIPLRTPSMPVLLTNAPSNKIPASAIAGIIAGIIVLIGIVVIIFK